MLPHYNYDVEIEKSFAIPKRLCNDGFRFIRVAKKDKTPIDVNYLKLNNFDCKSPTIQRHLRNRGNIGIIPVASHCILDTDKYEEFVELGIAEHFKDTFTVKTGGSGEKYHFYIKCPGFEGKFPLTNPATGAHIGDFYGSDRRGFCVAPPSVHPSGRSYEVVKDVNFKEFEIDELKSILSPIMAHTTGAARSPRYDTNLDVYSNEYQVADILPPYNAVKINGEIQGIHPVHGSTSGKNYSIDETKNVWHCFRCNTGGSWIHALLMKYGFIDCSECVPGSLTGRSSQIKEACEMEGIQAPQFTKSEKKPLVSDDIQIHNLNFLPEKLPDCDVLLIKAHPRTGKTHKAVQHLINHGRGAYVCSRHSVLEHALDIFKELRKEGQTAVHLEGKSRVCPTDRVCYNCGLNVVHVANGENQTKDEMNNFIREVMLTENVITCDILLKKGICPYYGLLSAKNYVDYIFTVPYFAKVFDPEKELPPQEILVFDEDMTIADLYPPEFALVETSIGRGRLKIKNLVGNINETHIDEFRTMISDPEVNDKPSLRMDSYVIDVLNGIIKWVKILNKATEHDKTEIKKVLTDRLNAISYIDLPFHRKEAVSQKLHEYAVRFNIQSREAIEELANAFIFINSDKRFEWIGKSTSTLFAIPERKIFNFTPFDKMIIIGQTNAELFVEEVKNQHKLSNCQILNVSGFKYAKNFIFLVIDGDRQRAAIEDMIVHLTEENRKNRIKRPLLVSTPSKKKQMRLKDKLGGGAIISTDETIYEQMENHHLGRTNIVYLNSVVSRGLDLDFYDMVIIDGSEFQTPYFTAMLQKAILENNSSEIAKYNYIIDRIRSDEITNMSLRISPVVGSSETKIKAVMMARRDFNYIPKSLIIGKIAGGETGDEMDRKGSTLLNYCARIYNFSSDKDSIADLKFLYVQNRIIRGVENQIGNRYKQTRDWLDITSYSKSICPTNLCNMDSNLLQIGGELPIHGSENREISESENSPKLQILTFMKKHKDMGCGKRMGEKALISWLDSQMGNRVGMRTITRSIEELGKEGLVMAQYDKARDKVWYWLTEKTIGNRGLNEF